MDNLPGQRYYIYVYAFKCKQCGNPIMHWIIYPNSPHENLTQRVSDRKCTNCGLELREFLGQALCSAQFEFHGDKGTVIDTRSNSEKTQG
jgi:hypothetical protein